MQKIELSLKKVSKVMKAILLISMLLTLPSFLFAAQKNAEKISLDFQDIPVRSVLKILAEHNKFNLVVSDAVQGNLSLHLKDVSWQKALDTILQIRGLAKRETGNILLIAPKTEMNEQKRLALEKEQQTQNLAPLRSEVIKINHASAEELMQILSAKTQNGDDGKGFSLLSHRGSIGVDARTNSLIVKEVLQNIKAIKKLVATLDIAVEQVEIEARIVSVDLGTLEDIGARWGMKKPAEIIR